MHNPRIKSKLNMVYLMPLPILTPNPNANMIIPSGKPIHIDKPIDISDNTIEAMNIDNARIVRKMLNTFRPELRLLTLK